MPSLLKSVGRKIGTFKLSTFRRRVKGYHRELAAHTRRRVTAKAAAKHNELS